MDLAETMKNIVAKGMQTEMGPPGGGSGYPIGTGADMSEMRGGGNQMNIQRPPSRPSLNIPHRPVSQEKKVSTNKQHYESLISNIPISDHKLTEFLRTNLDNLDSLSGLGLGNLQSLSNANKDLLALHNGAWSLENEKGSRSGSSNLEVGQEKIIRAYTEVIKNTARMKACIRPAMCKPYGKQYIFCSFIVLFIVALINWYY